jgi:hypothetical protein
MTWQYGVLPWKGHRHADQDSCTPNPRPPSALAHPLAHAPQLTRRFAVGHDGVEVSCSTSMRAPWTVPTLSRPPLFPSLPFPQCWTSEGRRAPMGQHAAQSVHGVGGAVQELGRLSHEAQRTEAMASEGGRLVEVAELSWETGYDDTLWRWEVVNELKT